MLDQARQADGDQEEQHDREDERYDHRAGPDDLRDLLRLGRLIRVGALRADRVLRSPPAGSCAFAEISRARKPITIEPPSATIAAHDRQAQEAVAASSRSPAGTLVTSISPIAAVLRGDSSPSAELRFRRGLAHGHRPVGDAAHHHALEHRLTADGGIALRLKLDRLRPSPPTARSRAPAPSRARRSKAVRGGRRRRRPHGGGRAHRDLASRGNPLARRAVIATTESDRVLRRVQHGPWRRGAGSARRARRCPSASDGPCRTGGSWSRPRRGSRPCVARVTNSLPQVQRTWADMYVGMDLCLHGHSILAGRPTPVSRASRLRARSVATRAALAAARVSQPSSRREP